MEWLTPGAGAVGAGLLSAGSSLIGGMFGAAGQQATNAQSMAMMQEQERFAENAAWENRAWEQEMSSTAYQRAMKDMSLAGLNPILAANLGGASSPSGSSPNIGLPSLGNPGSFLQQGITSAGQAGAQAAQTKAVMTQAEKDRSQVDLNTATETKTRSDKVLADELAVKAKQDTATSAQQAGAAAAAARSSDASAARDYSQVLINNHDANTAYQKSRIAAREADDRTKYGPGVPGDVVASGARIGHGIYDTARDLGQAGWNAYSENVGKPFARAVGSIIDKFRSGENPGGLTIDVTKPRR